MNENTQEKGIREEGALSRITRSAAGFMAAQLTIFYLFWIMFFGEVIRWLDGGGDKYRPIRDSFLIPFSDIFTVGHHWVGKILTGTIILVVLFFAFRLVKYFKTMTEEKLIKHGYALIVAFWVYSFLTLVYFIGHLNHWVILGLAF